MRAGLLFSFRGVNLFPQFTLLLSQHSLILQHTLLSRQFRALVMKYYRIWKQKYIINLSTVGSYPKMNVVCQRIAVWVRFVSLQHDYTQQYSSIYDKSYTKRKHYSL